MGVLSIVAGGEIVGPVLRFCGQCAPVAQQRAVS